MTADPIFASPTRLEGMETGRPVFQGIPTLGLRPALRGWKPRGCQRSNNLAKSPTRLEGMETVLNKVGVPHIRQVSDPP